MSGNKFLTRHVKVYLNVLKKVEKKANALDEQLKQSALNELLISKLKCLSILNEVEMSCNNKLNYVQKMNFFTEQMELVSEETDKINKLVRDIKSNNYILTTTNKMVIDVFLSLENNIKEQLLLSASLGDELKSETLYTDSQIKDFVVNVPDDIKDGIIGK